MNNLFTLFFLNDTGGNGKQSRLYDILCPCRIKTNQPRETFSGVKSTVSTQRITVALKDLVHTVNNEITTQCFINIYRLSCCAFRAHLALDQIWSTLIQIRVRDHPLELQWDRTCIQLTLGSNRRTVSRALELKQILKCPDSTCDDFIHRPKYRERRSESGERSARRRHRTARVKASAHYYNSSDTHVSNPHRYYSQRYELHCAHTLTRVSAHELSSSERPTWDDRILCLAFDLRKKSNTARRRFQVMRGQHTVHRVTNLFKCIFLWQGSLKE